MSAADCGKPTTIVSTNTMQELQALSEQGGMQIQLFYWMRSYSCTIEQRDNEIKILVSAEGDSFMGAAAACLERYHATVARSS